MSRLHSGLATALVLALTTSLPLVGSTSAAAKSCVLAGGEATMITEDLARFMANAALENSIKGKGLKAAGAVKMTCKPGFANTHCIARQKACK